MDNLTLTECDIKHLTAYVEMVQQRSRSGDTNPKRDHFDHFHVQKWFYFVIIATTTIGYGDVCPKTEKGRIFYCCFSVVGIVLMMSLLKSCGGVLNSINKRFHQLVRYYLCPGSSFWSEEFLSIITMTLLFIGFLACGILHDSMTKREKHSLVDITYFWIVSLTTVGFGDISHSLEFEIEHAYELTVYRVFGLSLVAGIIESIQAYIALRNETLRRENFEKKFQILQKKIMEKAQAALPNSPFNSRSDSKRRAEHGLFNALQQMSMFEELDVMDELTEKLEDCVKV